MIYVTGNVTILFPLEHKIRKRWKRKVFTLEFQSIEQQTNGQRVNYTYTAFIEKSRECRFLEDYIGKVKPFIESQTQATVARLQVKHLNYVSEETIQRLNLRRRR